MLYFIFMIMIFCGIIDGVVKLNSPYSKTRTESENLLDFLLSNK